MSDYKVIEGGGTYYDLIDIDGNMMFEFECDKFAQEVCNILNSQQSQITELKEFLREACSLIRTEDLHESSYEFEFLRKMKNKGFTGEENG